MTPDRLDWTMLVARTKSALRSSSKRWEKVGGLGMKFKDWFVSEECASWGDDLFEVAHEAWDYQQERIDSLEHKMALRDAFISGMTYPKVVVADDKGSVRLQTDDFGNVSIGAVQEDEWIGLTDDEVEEAFSFPFHYRSFYKAVEAKLKEKNA